jgi:hypothetical protein
MSELIADFIDTLNHDRDDILDSRYPEDRLHEEADSAVPIYNSTLAELLADDQSLAQVDDPGLVSEDADIWKRIQVAIYERLLQEGHEWLREAKEARDEDAENEGESRDHREQRQAHRSPMHGMATGIVPWKAVVIRDRDEDRPVGEDHQNLFRQQLYEGELRDGYYAHPLGVPGRELDRDEIEWDGFLSQRGAFTPGSRPKQHGHMPVRGANSGPLFQSRPLAKSPRQKLRAFMAEPATRRKPAKRAPARKRATPKPTRKPSRKR